VVLDILNKLGCWSSLQFLKIICSVFQDSQLIIHYQMGKIFVFNKITYLF